MGLQHLIENCPHVEMLTLSQSYWVTNKTVLLIAHHLLGLSQLNLAGCYQVDHFACQEIAYSCRNLTKGFFSFSCFLFCSTLNLLKPSYF